MSAAHYWLVMPAAGVGRRMQSTAGALPKQYQTIAGRRVIEHALAPFLADQDCQGVIVCVAADDPHFQSLPVAAHPRVHGVPGGAERRDSVLAGLHFLATRVMAEDPWVLVHDAVRPCLRARDLAALKAALVAGADGALLATRLTDTLKRADADERVQATVSREGLWRALTPQGFRLRSLMAAIEAAPGVTDEASAMEACGHAPRLVMASGDNLKITESGDLALAARILEDRRMTDQRIGFGVDVHAFGAGDHVWLGGERIPFERGLIAHSDGDVLLHALCDALLGAAALGDIGQHFPDSDASYRGVASMTLLGATVAKVAAAGYRIANVDLTLMGEQPRLSPYRDRIRARLAAALQVSADRVNLKATTTERLGFLGRGEGLAAQAVALLEKLS